MEDRKKMVLLAWLDIPFCNRMNIRFLGNAFHFPNVLEQLYYHLQGG